MSSRFPIGWKHEYLPLFLDKSVTDGQAEAHILHAFLGGEKGIEYLVDVFSLDPYTGVFYLNIDVVPSVHGLDRQRAPIRHGISCIRDHVEEDLAKLIL